MKKQTTCDEVQKNISKFIDCRLDSRESLRFINHIRTCETCMEELSVEYLVVVGIKRLDEASAFNLNKELDELIYKNEKKAKQKRQISFAIFLAAVISAIVGGYFLSGLLY